MPSDLFASVILPILSAFFTVCCCTRFITGRQYKSALSNLSGPSAPPIVPYWIPFLGHLFNMFPVPTQRWRVDSTRWNLPIVYSLSVCGSNFTVINGLETLRTLLETPPKQLSWVRRRWHILQHVFGASVRHGKSYEGMLDSPRAQKAVSPQEEHSPAMRTLIRTVEEQTPEFVSCNESIVDQTIWEREAYATVDDRGEGPLAVHVNLFALIKGFVSTTTASFMIGGSLADQPGSLTEDIWHLERSWKLLTLGLPFWVPFPSTLPARGACRRMRLKLQPLVETEHDDLDEYSAPFQERMKIYTTNNTPVELRASLELSLLWTAVVQTSSLTFWMLLHIFQTHNLAHTLRHEIKDHVHAVEPENAFRLPEPRRVSIDAKGLLSSCPTLRKCLDECVRLYADSSVVLEAKETFTISPATPHTKSVNDPASHGFKIQAGDILILDLTSQPELHNPFDPTRPSSDSSTGYRECLTGFQARESSPGTTGHGTSIRAESHVLVTVAAIISLWDVEPAGTAGWQVPRSRWNSMVASPDADIRVAIKPRKLS